MHRLLETMITYRTNILMCSSIRTFKRVLENVVLETQRQICKSQILFRSVTGNLPHAHTKSRGTQSNPGRSETNRVATVVKCLGTHLSTVETSIILTFSVCKGTVRMSPKQLPLVGVWVVSSPPESFPTSLVSGKVRRHFLPTKSNRNWGFAYLSICL